MRFKALCETVDSLAFIQSEFGNSGNILRYFPPLGGKKRNGKTRLVSLSAWRCGLALRPHPATSSFFFFFLISKLSILESVAKDASFFIWRLRQIHALKKYSSTVLTFLWVFTTQYLNGLRGQRPIGLNSAS